MKYLILAVFATAVLLAEAFNTRRLHERQACDTAPTALSSNDIAAILSLHNQYRANDAAAAGASIPAQQWNDSLAIRAQAWTNYLAKTNGFSHGYTTLCSNASIGQNLWYYGASSPSMLPSASAAVTSWYSEKPNYIYATNKCSTGMCGHYTQIVWSSSVLIGCGASYYQSGSFYNVIVACNYYPPGNYAGQKPY